VLIDAAAPAMMVAYAVGRMGCHISGDGCWGIENTAPKPEWLMWLPDWMWAYDYPHNVINEGIAIENCHGSHCRVLETPVFPTSLYESTICTLFFAGLWFLRKYIKINGLLFGIYLILNGIERYSIEGIRVNIQYDVAGAFLTQARIIAICLMLVGVALSVWCIKHSIKILIIATKVLLLQKIKKRWYRE